jgi:hypothetical protein
MLSERKKVTSVKRRYKTIFLIAALVLIPVLLGLIPLNLEQKLASGAPLSPVKQVLKCNPCFFHSVASHAEAVHTELSPVRLEPRPVVSLASLTTAGDVIPSGFLPDPPPLRC